jgi:hypothetical protein
VNDFDEYGEIRVVESGRTVPVGTIVPEPAAWMLSLTGALLCIGCAAARRRALPLAASRPREGV